MKRKEVWKDIDGYDGLYQVSNLGRVRRIFKSGKMHFLSGKTDKDGYTEILLSRCRKKYYRLHRLVASAFVPNPQGKPEVNHKDRNKRNNEARNLEWVTSSENVRHTFATGRRMYTRQILQYTPNMDYIRSWDSIKEACEVFGMSHPNVTACCRGRLKTSGGYVWRYKEVQENGIDR